MPVARKIERAQPPRRYGAAVAGSGPARSRLTEERETALFAATRSLLVEVGYEALTMDAVAHEAHTSKATIYRQWRGKAGLVVAALRHMNDPDEPLPDTGSLRRDLLEVARSLGSVAVDDSRLIAAASHAMQVDPELAAAVRERLVAPGIATLARLLERAVARGEIAPAHPALDWVPRVIISAFFARPLVEGRPADAAYLTDLFGTVVLPALGQPPAERRPLAAVTTAAHRPRGPRPRPTH